MKCSKCGSRDIDFQESIGQSICVNCGTVLEENTIVSSIEFQESGDRSHVVGQYISASCSKPYSGGRPIGGHGESRDPRDATLVNARRTITQRNFIFGRKQLHVVATCLYIICRQEKSPHLLIDFSDALQVNVYVLGKAFLQFSKVLNLNLPVVDPSLYIHRYAIRLDLGESRASVVATALRIITRLKKDWIATGRRPDGICALAMLVSARAHDFEVNQDVICKLFRVSPDLLRRRIEDFRSIPSAQLTLEQFHTHDTEVEYDPPAFIRNVVRDNTTAQTKAEAAAAADPTVVDRHQRSQKVRLALPSADPNRKPSGGAGGTVSALVAAAAMRLPAGVGHTDSDDEGRGDGEGDVMKDSDNLISDPVYQAAGSKGNDSEDDVEAPSQRNSWNLPHSGLGLQHSDGEQESFFKTKIADIEIVVPIPGQHKRRRTTDHALLKIQQRKDLYEDVYQQVLEDCRGNATVATDELDEKLEALQKEAQMIEDATEGVGGWGENYRQLSRIKERRIVLCMDNASAATVSVSKSAAATSSSSSNSSKGEVQNGKIKFRKLNNGADASMAIGVAKTEPSTGPAAGTTTEGASAEANEEELEDMLGEELGRYLLTEEEQQKRTLIWEKTYGPFMKEREERRKAREREQQSSGASEKYTQNGKLRRKYTRKALAAAAGGAAGAATTSQAVLQAQQTRSSKKINYDALKGVFGEDGSFAAPSASAADTTAAPATVTERGSHQAYLDSLMGLPIPGLSDPAAPILGPLGGAVTGAAGGFQKDVRNTLLGSSIAKTSQSQRGAPQKDKERGGNLLTAGTALSRGAGMGRGSKLGPALDSASTSRTAADKPSAPAPIAAAPTAAVAAATEDMVDEEGEEEDQLLYEGGAGEDGDYDDYDDEYY